MTAAPESRKWKMTEILYPSWVKYFILFVQANGMHFTLKFLFNFPIKREIELEE